MASPRERRLFERFSSRFPVKFKDAREGFGTSVYLRDASASGLSVTSKERFYVNDIVSLEVSLPDGKEPVRLSGRVQWARPRTSDAWDLGIQFHKIRFMGVQRLFELAAVTN